MTTTTPKDSSKELAERGWRTEIVTKPDGTITYVKIPLTFEEFLHLQEELYDVAVIPSVRRPMDLGFQTDEIRRLITVGTLREQLK